MSQEVRDAVARLEGWKRGIRWEHADGRQWHIDAHPIPDDLTACAKAWDEHAGKHGWTWDRSRGLYYASHPKFAYGGEAHPYLMANASGGKVDAASELRDRWRLLWEVLKARGVV